MRFEAKLDEVVRDKDGKSLGTVRDNLTTLAERRGQGARGAITKLTNPHDFPESLRYLMDWYYEVAGGDGLTWHDIDAWQRATGRQLDREEAAALFRIDAVKRHPEEAGK